MNKDSKNMQSLQYTLDHLNHMIFYGTRRFKEFKLIKLKTIKNNNEQQENN